MRERWRPGNEGEVEASVVEAWERGEVEASVVEPGNEGGLCGGGLILRPPVLRCSQASATAFVTCNAVGT